MSDPEVEMPVSIENVWVCTSGASPGELKHVVQLAGAAGACLRFVDGDPRRHAVREFPYPDRELLVVAAAPCRLDRTIVNVLRHSRSPVWIARPFRPAGRVRVLAAIAAQPGNTSSVEIVCFARRVAAWLCGELHVLHAWHAYGENMLRHSAFAAIDRHSADNYVNQTRQEHAAAIREILKHCGAHVPDRLIHMVKGEPGAAIIEFCARQQIDVLVMGTFSRRGLAAMVAGNTAEQTAAGVECSVVVLPLNEKRPGRLQPGREDSEGVEQVA
jgi:nucleotide-binding universal stress UspA family protein